VDDRKPLSTSSLRQMKERGEPIAVLTAYDFPSAKLADEAGVDVLLVGDSLGMVVLGYESTIPVTVDDMVHHTKAVTRAAQRSFVLTDMPFLSYHGSLDRTLFNAARMMQEGLAKAVKMEGGAELAATVEACTRAGVPVMGHIGLTPQAVHQIGGYKLQGRQPEQAAKLLDDALALAQAGAFAVVLEMVPEPLARLISERIPIPTIGIGAGRGCDGQVLVYHDMLQYGSPLAPKFVKPYAALGKTATQAIGEYIKEVKNRTFPDESHVYSMDEEALSHLYGRPANGAGER
jgi:3-methyl-2-oxobutanoate hydroxymethyltransferase